MKPSLKSVAVASVVAMYLVLVMGALVTNSGSAEGCGRSWPLCKGVWMPEFDVAATIEFGHRAISGLAGLLVVGLAVWMWRRMHQNPAVRSLAVLAVLFLVVQAGLGAAAVLWPQPKLVLAAHFGISLVSFSGVLLLTVLVFQAGRPPAPVAPVHPVLRRWTWFTIGYMFVVIYLGAYVRHIGAGAACVGWPLCNGEILPVLHGPVGAGFLHRAAAALALVVTLRLALLVPRLAPDRRDLALGSRWVALLLLLQIASGAVMGLGWLNLATQMVHSSILVALFGTLSYLGLQVLPPALRSSRAG